MEALNEIFLELNWNGRYQRLRCGVLLLSVVATVIQNWSVVFIGKTVAHKCKRQNSLNITIEWITRNVISNGNDVTFNVTYGECSVDVKNGSDIIFTSSCYDGYEYYGDDLSSFVPEWNLVCDRKIYSDFSQTVYITGQLCGNLLTRFADTHGRRKMYLVSSVLSFISSLLCAFPPNLSLYMVFNFVAGLFISISYQLSGILILEMMPKHRRALPEQIQSFLWSIALLLLCLLAYVTRHLDWRYVQVILSLSSVYMIFQWPIIDESLQWLFVKKRFQEAQQLIEKIAKINNVNPSKSLELLNRYKVSPIESYEDSSQETVKLLDMPSTDIKRSEHSEEIRLITFIKNRNLLKVTLISSFLLLVDVLAYEGLLMISPDLTSDFYLGFTLAALTDLPAALVFTLFINRIGRKRCVGIFHLMAGLFLLVAMVMLNTPLSEKIPGNYWFSLVLSLMARLTLSAGYSAVLIYVPELFPTSIRNTGCGISFLLSYISSMVSPYSRTLSKQVPWVPNAIFGTLCIIVCLPISLLPETQGKVLPQTIVDMDRRMNHNKTIVD